MLLVLHRRGRPKAYYPDTLEDPREYSRQVVEERRQRRMAALRKRRRRQSFSPYDDSSDPDPDPDLLRASWSTTSRGGSLGGSDYDDDDDIHHSSGGGSGGGSDEFVIFVPTPGASASSGSTSGPLFPVRMSVPVVASSSRGRPPHYRRVKSKSSPGLSWTGSRATGGAGSLMGGGSFLYTLDEDRQVLPRDHHRLKKMLSSSL